MADHRIRALERELQSSPSDTDLLLQLSSAYERSRQQARAFVMLFRALRVAPDDAQVRDRWAEMHTGKLQRLCTSVALARISADRVHAVAMLPTCEDAGPLLLECLGDLVRFDTMFLVRAAAAAALGEIGDAQATETLITALDDEAPWVRARAVDALQRIHHGRGYRFISVEGQWLTARVAEWSEWWVTEYSGGE